MFSTVSKIKILTVLILCLSFLCFSAYADGENLFNEANAGCEVIDDFKVYTYSGTNEPDITRVIDNDVYRSGNGSLKVTVPGSYRTLVGIKPTAALVEGEDYVFSFWYYNTENKSGKMYLRFTSITGSSISNWVTGNSFDSEKAMENGGWNKYEYRFTATNKVATDLKYFYITSTISNGDLYFDDISLVQVPKTDEYVNLFDEATQGCEEIADFNTNTYQTVTRAIDNTVYHSGNGSVKVTVPGSYQTFIGLKPTENFVEGGEYTFSAWYKSDDAQGHSIYLRYATVTGHSISKWITGVAHDTKAEMVNGEWTKFSYTFTATSEMANDLRYLYMTTTMGSGEVYFDDFALRKVPQFETTLVNSDLGMKESAEEIVLEFEGAIDEYSLPGKVAVNGKSVNTVASLAEDGKTLTLAFDEVFSGGKNTITFACEDIWNRKLNVSASFNLPSQSTIGSGDNLFESADANAESAENFEINDYKELDKAPVERTIDYDIFHSGNSSLKIGVPGDFRSMAGIAPSEKLVEGKKYTFSVWYYKPDAKAQHIYLRYATVTGHSISRWITGVAHDTKTAMVNGEWTKFSYTFTATNEMANDLRYLYITTTMKDGEFYLDDFALRIVPDEETQVLTEDFGKMETLTKLDFEFSKELDKFSLPTAVLVDETEMGVDASVSDDLKTLSLTFKDAINSGSHNISFECDDMWNRPVSVNAVFETQKDAAGSEDVYGNLFNPSTAYCEELKDFIANAYPVELVEKEIDSTIFNSGSASVKTYFQKSYKPLLSMKPKKALIPGEKYYFSIWYYTNDVKGTPKMYLRYANHNNTGISNWVTGEKYDSGKYMQNGGWYKYEYEFIATDAICGTDFTNFYITSEIESGSICFDDINLRRVPAEKVSFVESSVENNAENVKLNENISFEFDGNVDYAGVGAKLYVNDTEENSLSFETEGHTLVAKTKGGFIPDTEYKIVLDKVYDAYGRVALENEEISFKTANRLSFDISFFDEEGHKLTKAQSGDITAKINIENNNGADTDCIAVVMVCEGQRVKKVYASSDLKIEKDDTMENIEIEMSDVPAGCYYKTFLWTNASQDLRTLSECIEFR